VIEFIEPTAPFSASDQRAGVLLGERSSKVRNGESRIATTGAGRRALGAGAVAARAEAALARVTTAVRAKVRPARVRVRTDAVAGEGILMGQE
jgi:hypothetical protein